MNKEEWIKLQAELKNRLSDFKLNYPIYRNGKNKEIRKEAERKVNLSKYYVCKSIEENGEVYELLTGGENVSDYGRIIVYDEFKQLRYFENDLQNFIDEIAIKIDTFN
jgi:hypothetical protein